MHPLKGIALKLCSVVLFVAMASLIKATSKAVPPGEAVFFRSAFAMPVILGWLAARGDLGTGLRVNSVSGHAWRAVLGTMAMGLMFAGLGLLPLPEVTALGYTTPLMVVVFAALFLGEDVGLFRLGTVSLGMVGVLIVLAPRLTALGGGAVQMAEAAGALVVLMGATCRAMAQIQVRKLVQSEQTSAIVFFFSLGSALLSLLSLPFGWVMPDPASVVMLVLAGVLGGLAQIFLTTAYRFGDASVIAPFDYASMLFALEIGYVIFDEAPTAQMLAGTALIVTAGIVIILREHRLGLRRERARQAKSPLE